MCGWDGATGNRPAKGWKQLHKHFMPKFKKLRRKLEHKQAAKLSSSVCPRRIIQNDPCT